MTKMERVLAAIQRKQVDRVPFSAYIHSTVHQKTVEKFTEFTLDFYNKYDPDYIKVMYDENYDTPVPYEFIHSPEMWRLLEEFDPHIGAFGRQLESLERIKQAVGKDVPVIQTIYSPFHVARRLAHRRILKDWLEDRKAVAYGLDVITANYARFTQACLEQAGIDGFFFAAYGCEADWMSEAQYKEMVMPSDLELLKKLNNAPVVILHIHGESNIFFNLLKDFPCNAISWEDRVAGPSLKEAIKLIDKCLVGGIDHKLARYCTPAEIKNQVAEAVQITNGRGLIIAPGCTLTRDTPPQNILAIKQALTL